MTNSLGIVNIFHSDLDFYLIFEFLLELLILKLLWCPGIHPRYRDRLLKCTFKVRTDKLVSTDGKSCNGDPGKCTCTDIGTTVYCIMIFIIILVIFSL